MAQSPAQKALAEAIDAYVAETNTRDGEQFMATESMVLITGICMDDPEFSVVMTVLPGGQLPLTHQLGLLGYAVARVERKIVTDD